MTEVDFALDIERLETLPADEAASLLFVMRDVGMDGVEESALERWLSKSGEHQAAWARVTGVWDQVAEEADPLLDAMRRDALMARPARRRLWQRMSVAASVAAVLVAGAVGYRQMASQPLSPTQVASAARTWTTGMGAPVTRTFADGTTVTLAPQSVIEIDYRADRRQMRLTRGRAFFAVAHQLNRPFEVLAAGRSITDIGTAFEVVSSPSELLVTVSTGRVAVRSPAQKPVEIAAGESFSAGSGTAPFVAKVDPDTALSWRDGYLDFRDTPLQSAVLEAQAYGGPKLTIDPTIAGIRVSGRFRWGDTGRLARVLAQMYPIKVVTAPDGALELQPQS